MADIIMKYKDVNGVITEMYPKTKDKSIDITSANNNIPNGITTVGDLLDSLGALAFEDAVSIPEASLSEFGVVKLSNTINDVTANAQTTAATTKAVSEVNAGAVHNTGNEDIGGLKNFTNGIIIQDRIKLTVEIDESSGKPTLMFETLTVESEEEGE